MNRWKWLARGNTPVELAGALGIDAEGLGATIAKFNSFVAANEDSDFQRGRMTWSRQAAGDLNQKNPNLGTISEPPFFGVVMHPFEGIPLV